MVKWASIRFLGMGAAFLLALVPLFSMKRSYAYDTKNAGPIQASDVPRELENVGVTEKLGAQLNLSLPFVDDRGESVTLSQYFTGDKPVLLTMVYYGCPSLCNFHLNGLIEVFKKMKMKPGQDFRFVAVSMDHNEDDFLASEKKTNYLKEMGLTEDEPGWHFLTGSEANVKVLADQLGFGFRWDAAQQQYAHSSVAYVMTPAGVISRYLYGIQFSPETLRLSLVEASEGSIASVVDRLILFCFQFNPAKNKYTIYAYNVVRAGGVMIILVLAIFLVPFWFREKKQPGTALKGES
ncbi:MAG: SCO family protein [Pseudobdellovibrionaceae bacterium]|nr:SCO family protein [Bdellovibrionales bacterium]USN46636.1 MAG: SCO family protein [Pseudobdellovibrionaceae bacterium]